MTQRSLALFIVAVLSLSVAARADDWTEFRGPTGQGISTARNLPTRWSKTENVVWRKAISGKG